MVESGSDLPVEPIPEEEIIAQVDAEQNEDEPTEA